MMTFQQFCWSEIEINKFRTFSAFIYGLGGWSLAFTFALVVTSPTDQFYAAQSLIFLLLVVICSISTYDQLRKRYLIYQLEERIARQKIRESEREHFREVQRWDGRSS